MNRTIKSLVCGIGCTFGLVLFAGLVLYGADAVVPFVLYWPLSVTDKLGVGNCAGANSISEKLACMRTAFIIDAILYPAAISACSFMFHRFVFSRRDRLQPSHVG
jgi:hypothetical protein